MPVQYISNAFVSEALECARRGGVDISALLAHTAIVAPGNGQVTAQEFGRLWLGIAEAMNDEFFGNGARAMRPGSFALMGHAVRDAATVEIALRRALRFLKTAIDEPYGTLSTRRGIARITLHDSRTDRSAFAYRTYWVILHGLTCWLARRRIPLHSLAITCPPPRAAADYGDFFGAPVQFHAREGCLLFDAHHLKRPARRSEAALKQFLRDAPGRFLIGYRHDEGSAARITALLKTQDPIDWPSFERLAQRLDIPPSTLRRHLQAQGSSFRQIKSELRRIKALALLRNDLRSIDQISHALGYSEPSAFFKAFKGWTGTTPGAYRALGTKEGTSFAQET